MQRKVHVKGNAGSSTPEFSVYDSRKGTVYLLVTYHATVAHRWYTSVVVRYISVHERWRGEPFRRFGEI